jgi:dipeptidyl aminopeptidase/acylaminoacyl peptidase
LQDDCRVPVTQSFRLYDALRHNGVAYPVLGHSPADPVHARDVDSRWVVWFAKYPAQ